MNNNRDLESLLPLDFQESITSPKNSSNFIKSYKVEEFNKKHEEENLLNSHLKAEKLRSRKINEYQIVNLKHLNISKEANAESSTKAKFSSSETESHKSLSKINTLTKANKSIQIYTKPRLLKNIEIQTDITNEIHEETKETQPTTIKELRFPEGLDSIEDVSPLVPNEVQNLKDVTKYLETLVNEFKDINNRKKQARRKRRTVKMKPVVVRTKLIHQRWHI